MDLKIYLSCVFLLVFFVRSLLNRRPTKATCTPGLTENNEAKIAETTITDLDVTQS